MKFDELNERHGQMLCSAILLMTIFCFILIVTSMFFPAWASIVISCLALVPLTQKCIEGYRHDEDS